MVVLVFSIVLLLVGLYFLLKNSSPATDKVVSNSFSRYQHPPMYGPPYSKAFAYPVPSATNGPIYLVMSKPTYSEYNNGEIAYVNIVFDIDYLQVGDIVTIGDKLSFIAIEPHRRDGMFFEYKLVPTIEIFSSNLNYINVGTKAYRDRRDLTDREKAYLKDYKAQQQVDYWNRNFRSKGRNITKDQLSYSKLMSRENSDYRRSEEGPFVDTLLYNPLLSPISPISIWNSDDDGSSSKWHSSSSHDNDSSSSSSSSWDSSSSYDSGSSDSGSSDCGGGD